MQKAIVSLLAVAGVAAVAAAQAPQTLVQWQARAVNPDGTRTAWTDGTLSVNRTQYAAGSIRVELRAVVSLLNATSVGLAAINFQPTLDNFRTTDSFVTTGFVRTGRGTAGGVSGAAADAGGAYGRVYGFTSTSIPSTDGLTGHINTAAQTGSTRTLRIARNTVTNWFGAGSTNNNIDGSRSIVMSQFAQSLTDTTVGDAPYTPGTTGLVTFTYGVDLDRTADNTYTASSPLAGFRDDPATAGVVDRFVLWYANAADTTGTIVTINDNNIIDPVTIELVPAPGALALLGLGGLAAARRRR